MLMFLFVSEMCYVFVEECVDVFCVIMRVVEFVL